MPPWRPHGWDQAKESPRRISSSPVHIVQRGDIPLWFRKATERSLDAREQQATHLFTPRPQANGEERHSEELRDKERDGHAGHFAAAGCYSSFLILLTRVCRIGPQHFRNISKNGLILFRKWKISAKRTCWCLTGLKHSNVENERASRAYGGEDYFGLLKR